VPKSGHVTTTKIENLYIDTRRKNSLIPKMVFFSIYDKKIMKIAENPFQKSVVTRFLSVLN